MHCWRYLPLLKIIIFKIIHFILFVFLGKPTPGVKWYKEGKELEANSSDDIIITFESESGVSTLIIRHVTTRDSAKYTCVARNALGSCSTSAYINVQGIIFTLDKNLKNELFFTELQKPNDFFID